MFCIDAPALLPSLDARKELHLFSSDKNSFEHVPVLTMIKAILVFNNSAKPRLIKFFEHYPEEVQQQIVRETFQLVSKRDENVCNFVEGSSIVGVNDCRLIYRHYATLYFIFCVDSSESELGILDLIQVFVETLDKCFEVSQRVRDAGELVANESACLERLRAGLDLSRGQSALHSARDVPRRDGAGDEHE